MLIAYIPLLVAIAGLVMFVFARGARTQRIGEHMLWTGLLVTLLHAANHTTRLF